MYAIDDCELVRSYMTLAMARLARRLHRYLFAISTLLYVRIRTSVESKRPNSVHILSETSLSFYLSYLIYRWPIYRVIFLLHESIIRRYWPTWISIVFIGFTGSRMCLVYCAIISPSIYYIKHYVSSKCLLSVNGMPMINNYLVNNKISIQKRIVYIYIYISMRFRNMLI